MGPPRLGPAKKAPKDKKKPPQVPPRAKQGRIGTGGTGIDLTATIPLTLQQLLLNVFKSALLTTRGQVWNNTNNKNNNYDHDTTPVTGPNSHQLDIKELIQTIKSHLYNRDFDSAFTDASGDLLRAYALRWSSTRALGYAGIFKAVFRGILNPQAHATNHVVCIGGGAGAEIVALAACFVGGEGEWYIIHISIDVTIIFQSPLHDFFKTIIVVIIDDNTAPSSRPSSNVPSGPKTQTAPLLDPNMGPFSVRLQRSDVLSISEGQLNELLNPQEKKQSPPTATVLVTLMFTLNELFSTSMAKTTGFLLRMTDILRPGAVLLIVDSPGSYSTLKLGKGKSSAGGGEGEGGVRSAQQERHYPMKFLLDHTLLSVAEGKWEQVFSQDSRWWRRDVAELRYDVGEGAGLEDMRFQVHIYRRLEGR
ncbi:25S rRNA (uracil2843-N3)-methyltransferase [Aspergillus tanneri]|uniref:25S rRNA (Uridine(2843)-N(3))-methyltransferase n=1 Tax=Aspergillus tanneri TaxID=1220188 RepID=A0A5M9MY16_9EURO|nr:uncharacterized protein ATNIH1004_000654 [Aspergillus tanneri]KAA8651758.1 hypothetical protein ATNIH1004_000654 [Aspergillus tanneri]